MSAIRANLNKCTAYPIQGDKTSTLKTFYLLFGGSIGTLPCQYLGLPLGIRKPSKVDLQKLIYHIASKLKPWKGKLFTRIGRLVLINVVLTSTLTYFLTSFYLTPWKLKKNRQGQKEISMDRGGRNKQWKMLTWRTVGIEDLQLFGSS
jgi:hypothetical protein